MPSLTEQVWFSRTENAAVCRGLHAIICRLTEMKLQYKYPADLFFPHVIHKFPKRAFNQGMADKLFLLWQRIAPKRNDERSKHRLDCFDLAALAFAVRVGRQRKPADPQTAELERKLERYRKRCKRSLQAKLGVDEYKARESCWLGFAQWLRYRVLPLRVPQRPSGARARHQQEFTALLSLAKAVMDERCREQVDEGKLERVVRLLKRELQRGRHEGHKVGTLVANPEAAKALILEFLRKRVDLKLKPEFMTFCERQSLLGEKFGPALTVVETPTTAVTLATITPPKVVDRIARIFREKVHPDQWEAVRRQVGFLAEFAAPPRMKTCPESFEELVDSLEPESEGADGPEEISLAADWLLATVFAIGGSAFDAPALVEAGYVSAVKSALG